MTGPVPAPVPAPATGPVVAVVGAGIAGLAAAFELRRSGAEVVVLDPADRAGGKLRTTPFAGVPLDESADMFLARLPWGMELARDLGIAETLVSPAIGSALVVHDGRLVRLPDGLVLGVPCDLASLEASGLLSPDGLAAVAADLARPEGPPDDPLDTDIGVGPLVRSRLGDEAFETLVDPLLSGVNAGVADELSAELGAAQLLAAARRDRSLVRAARAQLPAATDGAPRPAVFAAPPGGMGALVGALVAAIGPERVELGRRVDALVPGDGGTIELHVSGPGRPTERRTADAVVLATPAPVTAGLLRPHAPAAADVLDGLRYASVAIVALAFRATDVTHPLDASGFLVPRRAGMFLTACSWSSSKFPHLGGDGLVRMRASVGRSDDTRFIDLDDDEIVARVRAELRELTGIDAEPVAVRVHRWIDSLPQYRPGHARRITAAEEDLAHVLPSVALAGASLRGLGVPACIDSGRRAARRLLGLP